MLELVMRVVVRMDVMGEGLIAEIPFLDFLEGGGWGSRLRL
jgi:hypothetical protein